MYQQIIIVRKDLSLSSRELMDQTARASLAFLSNLLNTTEGIWELTYRARGYRDDAKDPKYRPPEGKTENHRWGWRLAILLDEGTCADWIYNDPIKVICGAQSELDLLKVVDKAKELGLEKDKDYFLIKSNNQNSEEVITSIGFRPLPAETVEQLSSLYSLF